MPYRRELAKKLFEFIDALPSTLDLSHAGTFEISLPGGRLIVARIEISNLENEKGLRLVPTEQNLSLVNGATRLVLTR